MYTHFTNTRTYTHIHVHEHPHLGLASSQVGSLRLGPGGQAARMQLDGAAFERQTSSSGACEVAAAAAAAVSGRGPPPGAQQQIQGAPPERKRDLSGTLKTPSGVYVCV